MTQAPEKTLPQAIQEADNLPSMPTVAVEVLQLTQDENATLDDLAKTLSMDPALAAKLLKLSNSSLFNLGAEVTTLQRACMVLGLKTVKLMSLSFSLVSSLHGASDSRFFDFKSYWHRSVVCAVAGRSLGKTFGSMMDDEAFLCGLLSRLGQLVLATCLADEYAQVCESSNGWPTFDEEQKSLGFTGRDVGLALLQSWELPELISSSVGYMHAPDELPSEASVEARELASILNVAALCEELFCGSEQGVAKQRLDAEAERLYKLTPAEVDEFLLTLEASIAETAEMLNIDMGAGFQVQEILTKAQAQLVQMSLGVATEMKEVEKKASQLESRNRELRSQAHTDKLTSLANRASFDEILQNCIDERLGGSAQHSLGLLIIDVDHFKKFNDTYGHQVGDDVLRVVGKVLNEVTRESDLPARYGGEEFAVILPRTTSIGLKSLAERIRRGIEAAKVMVDDEPVSVTASLGGACVSTVNDQKSGSVLIKIADHYLYKAKDGGRNRCEFYPQTQLPKTG